MNNKKEKIALNSVVASLFLTIFKLVVGLSTGSIGILSEAIHSGLDFSAAFITLVAVKISGRPADLTHHYGYGKVESLSALFETGLLVLTSVWIVYEAVNRLIYKTVEVQVTWVAFLVMIVSIVVDISRSRALYKVARQTNSQALEADALHFKSDIYNSVVVLIGLVLLSYGVKIADSLAAIGVSILVLFAAYNLGKRTLYVLMDRAPEGMIKQISDIAKSINGVSEINRIRIRPVGPSYHIELSVGVSRTIPLERSHRITDLIDEEIKKQVSGADVIVHVEPVTLGAENIIEKVQVIAANKGYPVHNIKVHTTKHKRFIDLDLEVSSELSLKKAHKVASELESSLRNDLGRQTNINVHIEPLKIGETESLKISPQEEKLINQEINKIKGGLPEVKDIHKVIIHKEAKKIHVSLHIRLNAKTKLEEAHKISEQLEEELKKKFSEIDRVVVHPEP